MWTIAVTQYECTYNNLAPQGCTQWYFGSSTGLIKTYNYQSGAGSGLQLANQRQNICIRYLLDIFAATRAIHRKIEFESIFRYKFWA